MCLHILRVTGAGQNSHVTGAEGPTMKLCFRANICFHLGCLFLFGGLGVVLAEIRARAVQRKPCLLLSTSIPAQSPSLMPWVPPGWKSVV